MTRTIRNAILAFGFLPLILVIMLYNRLPLRVAMEWSLTGQPVWHASRLNFALAILIAPLLAALLIKSDAGNLPEMRRKAYFPYLALAIAAIVGLGLAAAVIANVPHLT